MKKSYSFLMAAALMAGSLASCTVNDDIQTKSDNQGLKEIKFSAGDITRGTVFTGIEGPDNMLVYAYKNDATPTAYITGATYAKGDDSKYTCTTAYYWPTGTADTDKLNFLALYPTTLSGDENFTAPTGYQAFGYTVPTTIANQKDVMSAIAAEKTSSDGEIALAFTHLLTQVAFKGYVEESANLKVTVTGISLCNVISDGSSTTGTALTAGSTKATYDIALTGTELGQGSANAVDLTTTNDNALLLMPQTGGTAWNTSSTITANDGESGAKGSYLKVMVKVQNKTNDDYVLGTSSEAAPVYFPLAPNWTAAKKVIYTLKFGDKEAGDGGAGKGLGYDGDGSAEDVNTTAITFTASVTDWGDVNQTITF